MTFTIIISILITISVVFLSDVIYTLISKKELSEKMPFLMRFFNRFILDKFIIKHKMIYGFTLFVGSQGGGKTYSAVRYCYELCKKNGSLLLSNTPLNPPADINYHFLKNLEDINYLPDAKSYVIFLDEIQTLFDSYTKNDDFYTIFCQLRKRNIKLVGTAQVFERVSLKLREQVHNLYACKTFFGCLTWVREFMPFLNSSGKLSSDAVGLGSKWYIQTDKIRGMYDTFFKI